MSGFDPAVRPSRAQRDAEADDARAHELAGEFGRLLDVRRQAAARTGPVRAASGTDPGLAGGGTPSSDEPARTPAGRSKGAPAERAPARGAGAGGLDPDRLPGDAGAGRRAPREGSVRDASARATGTDDPHHGGAAGDAATPGSAQAMSARTDGGVERGSQASAGRTRDGSAPAEAAGRAGSRAEHETVTNASVDRHRHADEALAERGEASARERASDREPRAAEQGARPPPGTVETRTVETGPADLTGPVPDRHRAASLERGAPARGGCTSALLAPETVAEIARLVAERAADGGREPDAAGPRAWHFSLVDEDDGTTLAFTVTRRDAGQLAVALDAAAGASAAPLLDELAARLARLDGRIVLEPSRG